MSKLDFYTFFGIDYNSVLIRGYKDGQQVTTKVPYRPFLFMRSNNADEQYSTIDGEPVKRLDFDSISEAREFTRSYGDISNLKLYGLNHYHYVYIYEMFGRGIKPVQEQIRILNFDIETDTQEGFGNIQLADKEIISITIKLLGSKDVYALGLKPYSPQEPELTDGTWNIKYKQCRDEKEILTYFIEIWKRINPDAVTGWNISFFDIPYIIKRITYVLGEKYALQLSPFGKINKREVEIYGRANDLYEIVGVNDLDYMQTYKKFSFTNEESYSLNYISEKNLKLRKLDYSEYGTLANLWRENHNKFIDYNVIDILRVEQLDDKLEYFDVIFAISYESLVNYADTFTTIRTWDILIHNYLMDRNVVVPFSTYNSKEGQIAGGFVKEPHVGKHRWVMSFDFSSLYPHEFMTYNISQEMYRGVLDEIYGEGSVDKILEGRLKPLQGQLRERNVAVTGKGTLFDRTEQGFIPAIMQQLYNRRKQYQAIEEENEKKLSAIKTELVRRGVDIESI